jgi:hypothetical protein
MTQSYDIEDSPERSRVSFRQLSDEDSSDQFDGQFIPNSYIAKKEAKILQNKKKFKVGIRKKIKPQKKENTSFHTPKDYTQNYEHEQNYTGPGVQPIEHDQDRVINEAAEHEEHTVEKSQTDKSSYRKQGAFPTNTSEYFAESDTHKRSQKLSQFESEMSIREPGDEYISASGEELAYPHNQDPDVPVKKTVKFVKGEGIPSSSEGKDGSGNDDRDFVGDLASVRDLTDLGAV